jgi:hypothetical protein
MCFLSGFAQHQEINEKPGLWKEKENEADSTSFLFAFRRGTFSGHFRYYFMATDNKKGLTDYYANAAGGGIKFETGRFKNFQVAVSGFFVYNIGSSDLSVPDATTKQMNRYETGLFDMEDPSNKKDIDRLEELYVKYHFKNNQITFGKQLINTPFINLQDGRMRPTEVEGFWAEINSLKKVKLKLGYIYGISPRSTVKWFKVAESIGIYPVGVNNEGVKSGYSGNLESKGIFLAGINTQITDQLKIQLWNQYTENIFNTTMLQADYEHPLKYKSKIFSAIQLVRQDAVKDGGNNDPLNTYFEKGTKAHTFGARLGWKNEKWEASLNYNRITSQGRYLMPREWGRDPFFTFLPRERNEGLGNVNALVGKVSYQITKARVNTSVAFGHFNLPDVTDYRFNKYGMPSYNQLNIDTRYKFGGIFKGLETQLLYVYKGKIGNNYGNDKFVINKVDMSLWNIVFNYQF